MSAERPITVLVVDDEPSIREVTRQILEAEGYRVVVAADGRQALDLLAREGPDLVLTDIVMPEMEGIEFLRSLRRQGAHIPILAMSGHAVGEQFLEPARLLGARELLRKPFRAAELLEAVRRALQPEPPPPEATASGAGGVP